MLSGLRVAIGIAFSISIGFEAVRSADPDDGVETMKEGFLARAQQIVIADAAGNSSFQLRTQPALSWSNPIRKTPAGAMFLWHDSGLPQVALCIYPNNDAVDLEFQSLSERSMTATSGDQRLWQPTEPGVRWQVIETDNPPATTPFPRLRQMRLIAREFSSQLIPPNKNPIQLRLLDTPVYRYESKQAPSDRDWIDGAMFAFVQGTDPEVLLLVEAIRNEGGPKWRYAIARMSMVPTQVHRRQTLVWETDWPIRRTHTPYYTHTSFEK